MTMLLYIVVAFALLAVVLNFASSKKTKLFRRIRSTERVQSVHVPDKQYEAVSALISMYGIQRNDDVEQMRKSVIGLLADAAIFDL